MHPQREELAAYLVGSLSEPIALDVEGHVQTCPESEATLNLLGSSSDTMESCVAALRKMSLLPSAPSAAD